MYLLYLDDSGSVGNASDSHIILAGIAVHEKISHWLGQELDDLAKTIWPDSPKTLEFRGADIRGGKKHWRGVPPEKRTAAFRKVLEIVSETSPKVRLFGAAIHKAACDPEDPMEFAFEQVVSRFDRFLGRLHKRGDTHRGLVILDESSYETSLQVLAREFKEIGHRDGHLRNMADVPLFVDSRATRLIQLADMIAYSLRRYVEFGEAELFDIIRAKFDAEGGVKYGLYHHVPSDQKCPCFCCI